MVYEDSSVWVRGLHPGLPPSNGEWHDDGSKLVVQPVYADAHGGQRAGMAVSCGAFHLIGRVHGPQTSYRAELMGLCVAATPPRPEVYHHLGQQSRSGLWPQESPS